MRGISSSTSLRDRGHLFYGFSSSSILFIQDLVFGTPASGSLSDPPIHLLLLMHDAFWISSSPDNNAPWLRTPTLNMSDIMLSHSLGPSDRINPSLSVPLRRTLDHPGWPLPFNLL